jgi:beta-glucanase (GH16 family)
MRRRLELCALGLALLCPSVAGAEGWREVFSDDFSGDVLNNKRWATSYIYKFEQLRSLGKEVARFADDDNHVVKNGILALVARPKAGLPDPYRFESGMIRSRQTFYYGYFEARVFLPSAKGSFPAFWLNPDYTKDGETRWPPEIDAFEYVLNANESPEMIHSSVHMTAFAWQGGEYLYRNPRFFENHGFFRAKMPLNRSWQTIGLLWKPDSVTSYLNGEKLWTRRYRWVDKFGEPAAPAHILFDFAVGGDWAGQGGVDDRSFPQQLLIDYIRVCQFSMNRNASPTCGGSSLTPPIAESRYRAIGDMTRSFLTSAQVTSSAHGRFTLRMRLKAVPTERNQLINLVATDNNGHAVLVARFRPSVPTSRWAGNLDMAGRFCVPPTLVGGNYRLWLGIGTPEAQGDWKNIPLTASARFGNRSGHLRYDIGTISIASERPVFNPCK